jgi:glutathione S-transferase
MRARLYSIAISHPAAAARLMLEHKGIEFETVTLQPGEQAIRMRLAGFPGGTVPGVAIGGRKVAGSRAIARLLDEVRPDPPLFPADPDARRAVEDAEAWGEEVLQPIPRRLLRWAVTRDRTVRAFMARGAGFPLPEVTGWAMLPVGVFYARRESALSTGRIRRDFSELPGHLERVDGWIADGVLGGEALNAADFQIGTTLRVMLNCGDYRPLLEGRPAAELARRVFPEYRFEMPPVAPPEMRAMAQDSRAAISRTASTSRSASDSSL